MSSMCPTCHTNHPDGATACPGDAGSLLSREPLAASDPPLEPGTMIGEYRVEKKLGEGSFGAVYAGIQPLIGKKVAIKLLHKYMSSDPEVVARFVDEARAVNRIGHRNIIDIFSFGVHAGSQHYFVMEFCEGLTLGELLRQKKRLEIAEALPILHGIANGLDAAHEASVTHRDLKPDNIFLVREKNGGYSPKLLDFGIAKLVRDGSTAKTATGLAMGTPRYMSPEQCRGKKVDHRTDIYALGCVVHELLTGAPVFDADTAVDLMFQHTTEKPPAMSSVCRDLPPELDEPVLAMLAKKPNGRPNSAGAAIAALDEAWQRASRTAKEASPPVDRTLEGLGANAAAASSVKPVAKSIISSDVDQIKIRTDGSEAPIDETGATLAPEPVRTEIAPVKSPVAATLASAPIAGAIADKPAPNIAVARTNTTVAATLTSPTEVPRRRTAFALPLLVAAILLPLFGFLFLGRDKVPQDKLGQQSESNSSARTIAAEPSTITLRVAVMPADARIVVDGRDMGGAGDAIVLPREKKKHAVRIERQGYEPQTMWISADADEEIGPISMTALAAAPATSSSTDKPVVPTAKPVSTKPRLNKDLWRPDELGGSK